MNATQQSQQYPELNLTRIFDTTPEKLFALWTDRTHLALWWGPKGFTNPVCEFEAREGGAIRVHMRSPDGTVYPMTGRVEKLQPPRLLAFTSTPLDAAGAPLFEVLTTVTFAPTNDGKTQLTLHAEVVHATPAGTPHIAGMEMGWNQTLDRLAGYARNH